MAALVAVGLIAYTGCGGGKEDPNAKKNAEEDKVDATHNDEEEGDPDEGGSKDPDEGGAKDPDEAADEE